MAIITIPVRGSSAIAGAEWNDETLELTVTFRNREPRVYVYPGVSAGMAEAFANARSKGSFLHRRIK